MGMITNIFRIKATADTLYMTAVGCCFLGMRMPGWLTPRCAATERQEDGDFTFDTSDRAASCARGLFSASGSPGSPC